MAEKIPITERIEREAKRRLEALSNPPAVVERWHPRFQSLQHTSAIVYAGEDTATEDSIIGGDGLGTLSRRLDLVVMIVVAPAEDDSESLAEDVNRWVARADAGLTDTAVWQENGTNETVAENVQFARKEEPFVPEGRNEAIVSVHFTVEFYTNVGDPYEGGGATEQTE